MRLRTARPYDALEVAELHVQAWQVAYRGLLFDEYLDGLQPDAWARRYTFGDRDPAKPQTVVAVEDGAISGFATLGPSRDTDRPGTGELLALYVHPARWGLGTGRALITEVRARLARAGFAEATVWVLVGNERAERFYQSDGWEADGARRPAVAAGFSVEDIRYHGLLD
jgi:GNAT superfamily N-acetyltransferase